MKTQAKIFTVLEFFSEGESINNHAHYVAATCSQEAEDVFKSEYGDVTPGLGKPHFYVLTDEYMQRQEDNGTTKLCVFYDDRREGKPMAQGEYTRWILSQTRESHDVDGEVIGPVYRCIA